MSSLDHRRGRRRRPRTLPFRWIAVGSVVVLAGLVLGGAGLLLRQVGQADDPMEQPLFDDLVASCDHVSAPEESAAHYAEVVQSRLERRLDVEGAASAACRGVLLHPDRPEPWIDLAEVSGVSAGRHGLSVDQARRVLEQLRDPTDPAWTRAHAAVALAEGRLGVCDHALASLPEQDWRATRIALDLALAQHHVDRAEELVGALRLEWPQDAGACLAEAELLSRGGRIAQAEQTVNGCLAAGTLDPAMAIWLADSADRTGRPTVALARYAAGGATVDAAILRWQDQVSEDAVAQARAALRGDSTVELQQRTWLALEEGDAAAALVESASLTGPARVAALLAADRRQEAAALARDVPGVTGDVLRAQASETALERDAAWTSALAERPCDGTLLLAWADAGGLDAAQDAAQACSPVLLSFYRPSVQRSAPWWLLVPQSRAEPSGGALALIAGDHGALTAPLLKGLVAARAGDAAAARRELGRVPRRKRDADWALAMALADLADGRLTEAQSAAMDALDEGGDAALIVAALAMQARGSDAAAIEVWNTLVDRRPWDAGLAHMRYQASVALLEEAPSGVP